MGFDYDDDLEIRADDRADAKASISKEWAVERHDNLDGSISYEVWSYDPYSRICRITDDDNPCAKRDAEHIVSIHNANLSKGK